MAEKEQQRIRKLQDRLRKQVRKAERLRKEAKRNHPEILVYLKKQLTV